MSSNLLSPSLSPSMKDQSMSVMDKKSMHALSDDECMSRLVRAVEEHDDQRLREIAQLIGRLAVPIE